MSSSEQPQRRIRSFVRREGRLTPAQGRALDELWPHYGIDPGDSLLDLPALFGRAAPLTLEIGFGNGEALFALAARHPEQDFIGIEVHRPGVGRLLNRLHEQGLGNVRVMCADAVEVLTRQIPLGGLDRLLLFFPDPWHKKRHHKRRIVQPTFVELVRERLRPGGVLHMATDWADYAEHMLAVAGADAGLENLSPDGTYVARPQWRPLTRFEQRGHRLGHGVWDLMFRRRQRSDHSEA